MVNGQVPQGMEIVPGAGGAGAGDTSTIYYMVKKVAAVTGQDLRSARASVDENNRPAVSFTLSNEGGRKFGKVSGENIGRQLAIILDGRVQSAPTLESKINSEGRITGSFTPEEVADLSLKLRSGALPAKLDYLEEQTIGPTLGADSIRSGVLASSVGLGLVIVFMLVYYKASGVNAVVALIFNLVILLGMMAYVGAVMTLPGIAGFVLTMGIGVDSNVLIFERIKEEIEASRGIRASINAGFNRVFWTLFDTHIAALISVLFLFQFDGADSRLRGHAHSAWVEPVHLDFVSKTLSSSHSASGSRSPPFFDFNAYFQRHQLTSCAGAGMRSSVRVIIIAARRLHDEGFPGTEPAGGTAVIVEFEQPPACNRCARRWTSRFGGGENASSRPSAIRSAPGDDPRAARRRGTGPRSVREAAGDAPTGASVVQGERHRSSARPSARNCAARRCSPPSSRCSASSRIWPSASSSASASARWSRRFTTC
jgi:protein-export membrane protein SecD